MKTLTILYTNDVHGAVDNFARAVYRIKQTRAELEAAGHIVLVIDGGDLEERSVPESHATRGAVMFRLLQAMGCHASALGNSVPFCYGPESVIPQTAYGIPIVCANLSIEGVVPTFILTFGNLKIGLTGNTHQMWGMYEELFGFKCLDPFDLVNQHVQELHAAGCQIVGVLAHIGMEHHHEFHRYSSMIDFVIDAHSHHVLEEPLNINNIPICQAGTLASHWGRLDLTFDDDYRVQSWWGKVYPVVETDPQNTAVLETWKSIQSDLSAHLDAPIARLPHDFPLDYHCASPMGELLAKAVHEHVKPELTMIVTGHLHHPLSAGMVTRRNLFVALPSPFMTAEGHLSGEEIVRILQRGADQWDMKTRMMRGVPTGIFQTVGLTYEIEDAQVANVRVNNTPIEMARMYHVGTSYFLYEAGRKFYTPDIDTRRFKLVARTLMYEALEAYLLKHYNETQT